ncbi:MAG: hypothetical protein P8K80_09915 [Phycisphaerales bacterium]|nr:hypothetical protein [Phycisphaerales bacterium]
MPDQPVPRKRPTRWWYWWPFLLGPAAILACYLSFPEDYTRELYKPFLEKLALVLASSALGLGIIRLAWQRLEYHLLLTLLSGAVLLREIHWDWTTTFVYAAVVILAAWGWCWRRRIDRFLDPNPSARCWLVATAFTYVLSQALARRVFRDVLPEEDRYFGDIEELMENLAHAMLIMSILVGSWRRIPRGSSS